MMLSGPLSLPIRSRMRSPSHEPNCAASLVMPSFSSACTEKEASRTQV
jgi:hypothetical protein